MASKGDTLKVVFAAVMGTFVLPWLLMSVSKIGALFYTDGMQRWHVLSDLGIALVPSLLTLACSVTGYGLIARSQHRLMQACAAIPPEQEGAPARCHVCGGAVYPEGAKKVARCCFCQADNLLSEAALETASRQRVTDLEAYVSAIRLESRSVTAAFSMSSILTLVVLFSTPFLCGVPLGVLALLTGVLGQLFVYMEHTSDPPTPGNRYGWVERAGEGRCVAWYNPHTGRWEVHRDHDEEGVEDADPVTLDALIGLSFVDQNDEAQAQGVAQDPRWGYWMDRYGTTLDGPDRVTLQSDSRTRTASLNSLCLDSVQP